MKSKFFFYSKSSKLFFFKYVKQIYPSLKYTRNIIPNHYNFILENFTKSEVDKIIDLKKKFPQTKIILICTEFVNSRIKTFNYFNNSIFYNREVLRFLLFLVDLLFLFKKKAINPRQINKYKKNKKNKTFFIKNNFFYKILEILNYKRRFNNFSQLLKFSDLLILSHPNIIDDLSLFKIKTILFPYQIKVGNKKKLNTFGFSGKVTDYRLNFFKILSEKFQINDLKSIYKECKININKILHNHDKLKYTFYSLNPKKKNKWPYSAPGRYLDSISYGEVPIVFDKFSDNFFNKISIYVSPNSKNGLEKLIKEKKKIKKNFFKKIKKIQKNQIFKKKEFINLISKL